ncbi:assimilatory nitrate reductase catalytic subunit [Nonomuraea wenchangensis]|uniref:Assimilatory nitrate reductase catalytic subunit n=2 Tax=Nonomuraea wenchangensis TaxID=568860 RepID=A0A1I0LLB1_9ACTN|nr:molybdopterin-dependent oxidoreductase [Nonomuraea wenchangensis]SEU41556.1 assimilatory nitrate reductase catalytic subunit [Nonomuraea wenchangensis]
MGEPVKTHCPYCALQCGMEIGPELAVRPRTDIPANASGALCQKGWTAGELLTSGERLTTPLLHGEPVEWDVALDHVAGRLAVIRAEHGPDAVAVFGGGGLTNEKAYMLGKFARVALGTSQIDYNGRFCMSSAAAASIRAFGMDRGMPFPVTDLAAADVVLLAGGNVAETMPPLVRHLEGPRLIVVDPRRSPTARLAWLHLQPAPGTDLALALGLLHLVVAENLVDEQYVAARTTGFADVRTSLAEWWPERVERITGVPVHRMRQAVRALAAAANAYVLTGRGVEQQAKGTDTVTAFVNLALALGLPGRAGSGYGCVTGQGNGQGGREHGQKADQLPGYRRIDDPAARAHVAGVWGVPPESLPGAGRSAYELLDALGGPGGPRALLVFGSNPLVSAPAAEHVAARIAALDLLVACDFVLSETAARADVVFPVTQWAEESGTMTNLEGRVLLRNRAVAPPDGVRSDLEVIAGLAARLGHRFATEPAEVFDELRRAGRGGPADYSGITYERIAEEKGVFWPCPEPGHPGTPRPFLDRFAHPDGLAMFVPVRHRPPAEEPDEDYPVHLTTGRVLAHYQSGAQTRRIAPLVQAAPEPFVELHPDLAERLEIAAGDVVRLTSRRGEARAVARISDTIRRDTVFMPFHWEGANRLTNPALDPTSRMPEFKVCAVRVERDS